MDRANNQKDSAADKRVDDRPPGVVLDLRWLILTLVVLSVLATLGNSLITAYRVQRDALVEHALQANSAYAAKVASSLSEFIRSAQSHLHYGRDRQRAPVRTHASDWSGRMQTGSQVERNFAVENAAFLRAMLFS